MLRITINTEEVSTLRDAIEREGLTLTVVDAVSLEAIEPLTTVEISGTELEQYG